MTTEVRNILKVYRQATEAEHKHGTTWYAKAQSHAQRIADKHVVPLRVVVGVIAALSPNNKWERNVTDADQMLSAFLRGDSTEQVRFEQCIAADKQWIKGSCVK